MLEPPGQRDRSVVVGLRRFGEHQGLIDTPPTRAVIEAFVANGLVARRPSTKGTYRSVLKRLGGVEGGGAGMPFAASPAPPPYTPDERRALWAIALAQRTPWRRHDARVLLALGIGAGLRAGELVAVTGDDVTVAGEDVAVRVAIGRPRLVPVSAPYADFLAELSASTAGHLLHPGGADRRYANFVNNLARHLHADPESPVLSTSRARSSFLCDHLGIGTPLAVLLDVAGIVSVESLLRYARHVPGAPRSKALLRARLRDEP